MTNEFTSWCDYYYEMTTLFSDVEEHFQTLVNNMPPRNGQTLASEVDAIIDYIRMVQAEKAKLDKIYKEVEKAECTILTMMQHFEIPPNTILTGEIPYKMRFEVWADEKGIVYICKTGDLAAEDDDPNVMVFKFTRGSKWGLN